MDEKNDPMTSQSTPAQVESQVDQSAPAAPQPAPAPEAPAPAPVQPEVQDPTVSEPVAPAAPAPEPEIEQQPAPMMTAEQPAMATDVATEVPKKSKSWQVILLIVLIVVFVGLIAYYWSTGGFNF